MKSEKEKSIKVNLLQHSTESDYKSIQFPVSAATNYNNWDTFAKFTSKAAIMAIVEEQTNAAELESPDPI